MNVFLKNGQKILLNGGKKLAKQLTPNLLEFGAKLGTEFIEKQKSLVRIPNLKDVEIENAMKVLNEQIGLTGIATCMKPSIALADENPNCVISSSPKFGSKVEPSSVVKLYYVTEDILEQCRALKNEQTHKLKLPKIVGAQLEESRKDLEDLGLRVTVKLEKAQVKFADYDADQTTRLTYTDGKNFGNTYIQGERICLWYVDSNIIEESRQLKELKEIRGKERIVKLAQIGKGVSGAIVQGVASSGSAIAGTVGAVAKLKAKKQGAIQIVDGSPIEVKSEVDVDEEVELQINEVIE